jgi:hypothetical protein
MEVIKNKILRLKIQKTKDGGDGKNSLWLVALKSNFKLILKKVVCHF